MTFRTSKTAFPAKTSSSQRDGAKQDDVCPVVAIGASAGGLEAYKDFFHGLPSGTGMAFVLVQHLDPSHQSMLPEIIAKATKDAG
jgi:two-component system CheB/CheR fusion protein